MNTKHLKYGVIGVFIFVILVSGCIVSTPSSGNNQEIRIDGAIRITYSHGGVSCQNPAFSPTGEYILFTRFLNGYNKGPSELVKINIATLKEEILISTEDSDNVNVPGPSWINGIICWSSDRGGESDEIYIANDNGENMYQVTDHPEKDGYYIEPIFNPLNTDKIIFEYVPSDYAPHHIAIVETDKGNRVTVLTNDPNYDDRLPNWSFDGETILFQRADKGGDNWQIYTAKIVFNPVPYLKDVIRIDQSHTHNTDNSWYINNKYILSSSDYNSQVPNIFAFSINGNKSVRITNFSENEDGAPSCSHSGEWIAFESHRGEDEEEPSDIWIIPAPSELNI